MSIFQSIFQGARDFEFSANSVMHKKENSVMGSVHNSAQTIACFAQIYANAQNVHAGNHDVWGIPTREGLGGNFPSWEFEGMHSLKSATRQRGACGSKILFQIGGLEYCTLPWKFAYMEMLLMVSPV